MPRKRCAQDSRRDIKPNETCTLVVGPPRAAEVVATLNKMRPKPTAPPRCPYFMSRGHLPAPGPSHPEDVIWWDAEVIYLACPRATRTARLRLQAPNTRVAGNRAVRRLAGQSRWGGSACGGGTSCVGHAVQHPSYRQKLGAVQDGNGPAKSELETDGESANSE